MRVFRWQHTEHGFGPLCGHTDFHWGDNFKDHNYPSEDEAFVSFFGYVTKDEQMEPYFFGWNSLELLVGNMFTGAEEALEAAGFELTEWEVSEDFIVLEDGQVVFNRSKALKII